MGNMFCGCTSLKEIKFSNFNTSNVINMQNMFQNCSSLIKLNLSNLDTTKVTNKYD